MVEEAEATTDRPTPRPDNAGPDPLGAPDVTGSVSKPAGYQRSDRTDMRQLIDATRR